jgi:hypothetical protein
MSHLKIRRFSELYNFLQEHHALERIQEILSPFRSPEELTIKVQRGELLLPAFRMDHLAFAEPREPFSHAVDAFLNRNPCSDDAEGRPKSFLFIEGGR